MVITQEKKPWWLYPNLLSLDAPLVAIAWLYIFAQTWRLGYHPWEAYASLGLAVWAIYVGDRLLDVSLFGSDGSKLEARHRFHQRHQKWLKIAVFIAVAAASVLLVTKLPMTIYRYLLFAAVLVAGFFGLSMLSSQAADEVPHSKNIIAGATFAFGTAMTAHMYRWEYGVYELIISREFICFAMLCIINIAAIDFWEHSSRSLDIEVKATDELALTLPLILLGFASLVFAVQDVSMRPFYYAILTGTALLYVLNRRRAAFSLDAMRVMADVSLMVPLLVFKAASSAA